MRYKTVILSLIMLIFSSANAIEYLLPEEFDDIKLSVTSSQIVSIDMKSPNSSRTFPISTGSGVVYVKYKCGAVPKIQCKVGIPAIYSAPITITLLNDRRKSIPIVTYDLVAEDQGANWYVCMMIGGDDGKAYLTTGSSISPSNTNKSNATVITYQECK